MASLRPGGPEHVVALGRLNQGQSCRAAGVEAWVGFESLEPRLLLSGSIAVTVDTLVTSDATPELTGTVDDPAAAVEVTVNGATYDAVNDGFGEWTLADDTLPDSARERRFLDNTIEMAEQALELGAQVIMMHPPTIHRGQPDQDARILAHGEALAKLDAPVLLFYLYEAAGGIDYSLDLLAELLSMPQVVAIKMATLDSVMTYQDVAGLVKDDHAETVLVTGEDRFLGIVENL